MMLGSGDKAHIETLRSELANERARFDALLERYHELRHAGAFIPRPAVPNGAAHAPARDMDEIGRDGARLEAIERMAADFQRKGATPADARTEAQRIIVSLGPMEEE